MLSIHFVVFFNSTLDSLKLKKSSFAPPPKKKKANKKKLSLTIAWKSKKAKL